MPTLPPLPPHLAASARRVGNDVCWPIEDAREVIEHLAKEGITVLGFELWDIDADGKPKVLGSSTYRAPPSDTAEAPLDAARLALDELNRNGVAGSCCQVTWAEPRA